MKKKFQKVLLAVVLMMSLGAMGAGCNNNDDLSIAQAQVNSTNSAKKFDLTLQVVGDDQTKNYTLATEEGQTVLAAMAQLKEEDAFTYELKEAEGLGAYVTSVNNLASTDGQNFWALYLNNKMASEGASTQVLNKGDVVKW